MHTYIHTYICTHLQYTFVHLHLHIHSHTYNIRSHFTVTYSNSLLTMGYYLPIVSVKYLVASGPIIEHPFNNLMDSYCSCFYHTVISNRYYSVHVHRIAHPIHFYDLSLLMELILFMLGNDLHYLIYP